MGVPNPSPRRLSTPSFTPDGAVVTAARSRTEPLGPRGRFQSEVHRVAPDGTPTPLTAIRGRPADVAISAQGSAAAFLNDPERLGAFDLVTLDVASGAVTRHGLLARVAADPAFRTT